MRKGPALHRVFAVSALAAWCITWSLFYWLRGGSRFSPTAKRSLVLYAYFEKNEDYKRTLQYFLDFGVTPDAPVDYVFILQGPSSVSLPSYPNVKVYVRQNDCFDFGAFGAAISWLGGLQRLQTKYAAAIFLNPSVVGPFLPKYFPPDLHWTRVFLDRLQGDVHLVGTSLVCLPAHDPGKRGPRIEGMAWAGTMQALDAAWQRGVFRCFTNKVDVIVDGEYGLSRAVLDAGMNLDALLLHYGPVDWRLEKNWDCNHNAHPSRQGSYGPGLSIHPLEVVFHKPVWRDLEGTEIHSTVYLRETRAYMEWAYRRRDAGRDQSARRLPP
jgi:hypothetical protein